MSARDDLAVLADEDRAGKLFDLSLAKFTAERNAITAGAVAETTGTCNSLLDYLANSPDLPGLVRTAFNGSAEVTGRAFINILVDVMRADAEQAAERELAEAERAAHDDPENCRPTTMAQALALEQLQA